MGWEQYYLHKVRRRGPAVARGSTVPQAVHVWSSLGGRAAGRSEAASGGPEARLGVLQWRRGCPDAAPENEPRPPSGFRSDGLPEPVLSELPTTFGREHDGLRDPEVRDLPRAKQALQRVKPYQAGQATRRQAPTWDYQSGYSGSWLAQQADLRAQCGGR